MVRRINKKKITLKKLKKKEREKILLFKHSFIKPIEKDLGSRPEKREIILYPFLIVLIMIIIVFIQEALIELVDFTSRWFSVVI